MRDILAPTRDSRSWQANVEYAARLSVLLEGTLTALYQIPPPIVIPDVAAPSVAIEIVEICREEANAAMRAQEPFAQWCRGIGVRSGSWHVAQGAELPVLQSAAKWHDLIVFERSYERSDGAALAALGAAVLRTDLPCIVLPAAHRMLRLDTVAIAWKGTAEATRALHAALPLLRHAGRIVLIHGEEGESADAEILLVEAEHHLQAHGLSARRIRIAPSPSAAGDAIFKAARDAAADLVVMGAYGRTRVSEWLFGGATRSALHTATMPVFMRH